MRNRHADYDRFYPGGEFKKDKFAAWSKENRRVNELLVRSDQIRLGNTEAGAEDVAEIAVTDAEVDVLKCPANYNGLGPFRTWFLTIAFRRGVDEYRKTQRDALGHTGHTQNEDSECGPALGLLVDTIASKANRPDEEAERQERIQAVREALKSLDEKDREILFARHYSDLPFEEVANEVGSKCKNPANGAKQTEVRALKRLKNELPRGFWEDEEPSKRPLRDSADDQL